MTTAIPASLRPMVHQDVRDAVSVGATPKKYPIQYKLSSCKRYCSAYKVSYDEQFCIDMIAYMDYEPGTIYYRYEPEGYVSPVPLPESPYDREVGPNS